MLDADLANAWGVVVVPIQITVDGMIFNDGVDLSPDAYYALVADGDPKVTTSQPSPGKFLETYKKLEAEGYTEIHSVHVGADLSGTFNSARLGAAEVGVPVFLYDSETTSFGVSIALNAVIEQVSVGADQETARRAMKERVADLRTAFFMDRLELSERGITTVGSSDASRHTVWTTKADQLLALGAAATFDEAAELMVRKALDGVGSVHIAVGIGDLRNAEFVERVLERVSHEPRITSITKYRVGPAVAAFIGPNSGGLFWYPAT